MTTAPVEARSEQGELVQCRQNLDVRKADVELGKPKQDARNPKRDAAKPKQDSARPNRDLPNQNQICDRDMGVT
jgi:hypothetical protein